MLSRSSIRNECLPGYRGPIIRNAVTMMLFFSLFILTSQVARAQNCDALVPSGGDDWAAINTCLGTRGYVTLTANTFLIYEPIEVLRIPGARIVGAGKALTKIAPQFTCGDPRFLRDGSYRIPIEVRNSPGVVLSGFHLDLDQLRKDCGHGGSSAIVINKSEGSRVEEVRITGSRYGAPDYTSGWAHGSGIDVINAANTTIRGCNIKDLGFSGSFAGGDAIRISSSGNCLVQDNFITNVSFGIVVVNGSPAIGYIGDSSGTSIINNTIQGASLIGCPDCSQGRAMKFEACGAGDEPPLVNLTVSGNIANSYGGQIAGQFAGHGGAGLYIVCGVVRSRFENNSFSNAPLAEVGVFINSETCGPPICAPQTQPVSATHHNTFNYNHFESGRGSSFCDSNCTDLWFGSRGPDQIGLSKNNLGTNTVGAGGFRDDFPNQCSQFGDAWFLYPSGQTSVYPGQDLLVTGVGIRPPSFFAVITFHFKDTNGNEVASHQTQRSNDNCVVNQESFTISPTAFTAGSYSVTADYYDGTASDLFIRADRIGTLVVTSPPNCTYSISPASASFTAKGGAGSFSVTAGTACAWTATSYDAWITITSGGSGAGNGSVNYSVAANGGQARTGTISIADKTFTLNQAGACTYSISPPNASYTASGGSGSIGVTTTPGCGWTAVSGDTSWITITAGSSGSGTGTVFYSVAPNTGPARSGNIAVAGQTFVISQDADAGSGNFSLALNGLSQYVEVPDNNSLDLESAITVEAWIKTNTPAAAQQGIVERYRSNPSTIDGGFALRLSGGVLQFWTMYNGWDWASVVQSSSTIVDTQWHHVAGVFDGSQSSIYIDGQLAGSAYPFYGPRAGTQTLKIGARGDDAAYPFNGLIDEVRYTSAAVYNSNFVPQPHLSAVSGTVGLWKFDSQNANDSSGLANHGSLRNGAGFSTDVPAGGGGGCMYSISPPSASFTASGGTGTVSVTAGTGCGWTANSSASWITITSGASGSGNGSVSYSVAANTGAGRSATITIVDQVFAVSQAGGDSTPSTPTNLRVTSFTTGTVNLAWDHNGQNLTGFILERKTGSGSFSQIATPSASARSYKDSTVSHGTTYSYRIKAVNGNLQSAYSNVVTVTP